MAVSRTSNLSILDLQKGNAASGEPFGFKATGGEVVEYGGLKYHTFLTSGNFVVTSAPAGSTIEYFMIAGGGSGPLAGGGAGGSILKRAVITAGTYPVQIGAGGPSPSSGENSTFNGDTAFGGGAGGGVTGGCGGGGWTGGGGGANPGNNLVAGSFRTRGNGGGPRGGNGGVPGGGGGIGAGGGGGGQYGSGSGGNGGAGALIDDLSIWVEATGTGVSGGYFGGGGGGMDLGEGGFNPGIGGIGGGGSASGGNGTANTGGGGGGNGGAGGSGILIVRYSL